MLIEKTFDQKFDNSKFFANIDEKKLRSDSDDWLKFMQIDKKMPEHQAVYATLRDRILLGEFAPGQPMTIQGLAEILGVGMTPVREAIRRLTSESALETLGNRRVIVPTLTQDQLDDIYFMRLKVEPELAKRAAKSITKQHVKELYEIDREVDLAINVGDVNGYLERNKAFHFNIYAHANSPILTRIAQSLWLQVGPSLRVVCGRYGTANLPDKHDAILQAFLDGNPEAAAAAMQEDLEQGIMLAGQPLADKFDQNLGKNQ
ncbi:GntR family transcriptional regulator [Yoonia sp. I 8.24]|uniref:GntR family transcriptional regulator n=1 Tax=Yoonia sp. I 8.24 TaxID=1537229 RepID=UPI001EE127EE|nr:GntR family transcriptional regulator [Yoonia sp. I 8.24]